MLSCVTSSLAASGTAVVKGVSHDLAAARATQVSDVVYDLSLCIPCSRDSAVHGTVTIEFTWHGGKDDLQLDFQGGFDGIANVNGKALTVGFHDEHIVIPHNRLKAGKKNAVRLSFRSQDGALNRNDDYMYTLFVPDHARSAFPCLDQPDIKARFVLSLTMPDTWRAISNAGQVSAVPCGTGCQQVRFGQSDPLPTYLFSFTAGKFGTRTVVRDGVTMTALYRESDPKKVTQIETVFDQAALSLRWLERYTGIRQPFGKYGIVILPGYQFGGMEHPGCIQLRDRTVFLGDNPTPAEELNRLNLIAHETSHLWFGDLVTMRWFDDVWTKEVFANFMADKIAREQFAGVNHDINFIKSHYPAALATDRTRGTHPIQQSLDNLNNAGLLYGNIIYHKAPIMMRFLEQRMGGEPFRQALHKYLDTYRFGNATWDDLISIMDSQAPAAGIRDFDTQWVKSKGTDRLMVDIEGGDFDPFAYGRYALSQPDMQWMASSWWSLPETKRFAAMMYIYEGWISHALDDAGAFWPLYNGLAHQDNPLIASTCCGYLSNIMCHATGSLRQQAEDSLFCLAQTTTQKPLRRQLLQVLGSKAISSQVTDSIYQIWLRDDDPLLGDHDYMSMAYHLAILKPQSWQQITGIQMDRLRGDDLRREFGFVSRGCNPDPDVQQRLFDSLLLPQNRTIEPYAAALLSLLNDPLREPLSNRYIKPGLEVLDEIQRTGDIFFPLDWCHALLGGHYSSQAWQAVRHFVDSHPNYPQPLLDKLLQASFWLENWHGEATK